MTLQEDLDLGIRISLYQSISLDSFEDAFTKYDFVIQNSFFDDYMEGHYKTIYSDITSTLQALTDAVTNKNFRKVHDIRKSQGGNSDSLIVNDYVAKRRNITTSIKVAYLKRNNEYKTANMKEHD